jgi:hypothetical protein
MRAVQTAVVNGSVTIPGAPAPASSVRACLLGVDALLFIAVDEHEHQRRRTVGMTAICDRDALWLLSRLPHGEAVRVADLTARERRGLRALPRGVVAAAAGRVTRLSTPPVIIRLAVVVDEAPDRGLDRASRFAPFAPRLLVLTRPTADLASTEVEARFYGIGLAVAGSDGVITMAEPEPARRSTGPVTWRVREQAYAAFLDGVEARP